MDRDAIPGAGYAGLGQVVALPWRRRAPAFDAVQHHLRIQHRELVQKLPRTRLVGRRPSNQKLVNGGDQPSTQISQVVQSSLEKAGIKIQLDLKQGLSSSMRCSRQLRRCVRRRRQRAEVPCPRDDEQHLPHRQ